MTVIDGLPSDWDQAPICKEGEGRGDTLRSFGSAPFDYAQGRQDKLCSGYAPRATRACAAHRQTREALDDERTLTYNEIQINSG